MDIQGSLYQGGLGAGLPGKTQPTSNRTPHVRMAISGQALPGGVRSAVLHTQTKGDHTTLKTRGQQAAAWRIGQASACRQPRGSSQKCVRSQPIQCQLQRAHCAVRHPTPAYA
jgi:hypothetical protein